MSDAPLVTLKANNDCYVSAEYGGGIDPRRDPAAIAFTANRDAAGIYEHFGWLENQDRTISLQTARGTFMTAEGGGGSFLRSDATDIGLWEKFTPVPQPDGKIALRCWDGHYVCNEELTPLVPLNATRIEAYAWEVYGIEGLRTVLPPRPDRLTLCGVQTHFQGLPVTLPSTGQTIRLWDPNLLFTGFSPGDRTAIYATKRALGDTHINLSLDLRGLGSLADGRALITEYLTVGGGTGVLLCCMGDGQTSPGGGYDPGARGREWLMANFQTIYLTMAGDGSASAPNLCPYIVFCPGYDGVVPAWQPPSAVDDFALMARRVLEEHGKGGALAMYLSAGYPTWGSDPRRETNNWKTPAGRAIDVIVYEGPIDMALPAIPANWSTLTNDQRKPWTQAWQIIGRMVRPFYPSAAQIVTGDDPNPPFLLEEGTPRGPFTFVFLEYDTWREQKGGGIDLSTVEIHRQAVRDMGVTYVG
jgi:hypothetical protein